MQDDFGQNSGCDTTSERQETPHSPAPCPPPPPLASPGQRTTGRSSAVAQPCSPSVILGPSPFASRRAEDQDDTRSRCKDPGSLMERRGDARGGAIRGHLRAFRGAEDRLRARDRFTRRLVCGSDGKRIPPPPEDTAARPQPAGSAHVTGATATSGGAERKYSQNNNKARKAAPRGQRHKGATKTDQRMENIHFFL